MFTYTAFEKFQILSHGSLDHVALAVRKRQKQEPTTSILIFSDSSGKQMDLDLSGSEKDVLERLKIYSPAENQASSGPGRPKLGVISREVSLLPKHWEWLSNQSGGASATIRNLLDEKMKKPAVEKDQVKQAQEVAYRFLSALAGDLPNFEEAIRYLYRRDKKKFKTLIEDWPKDLQNHTFKMTEAIFGSEAK
jgi:hypothetical protein